MRRVGLYIPLVIIYLTAFLVLIDFFTDGLFDRAGQLLALWVSIITGFLLLLGLVNVARVHLERIRQRHPSAAYSAVLLVSALAVIIAGIVGHVQNNNESWTNWIFQYVYQPLSTTLFSLLAFLMVGAAVRALRIGTVESTLLVVGALVVLVGQVAIWPVNADGTTFQAALSQWFQDYPVLGAIRGILIGTALGAIATSLRYLLGVDNQYLR